jgi:hypothetical protein
MKKENPKNLNQVKRKESLRDRTDQ